MALCSRCLAIPFRSLPPPHSAGFILYRVFNLPDIQNTQCLCSAADEDDENGEESEHALGYPWHPDLDSLAASASDCVLCQVVHKGIQNWLRKFKEGKAKDRLKNYAKQFDYPLPEGRVLYLTQRYGGGPGFNIMMETTRISRQDIYILPGVAFSVDENHPLAQVIQQRPPDAYSGSNHSLSIAKSFLTRCRDQHETCKFLGSEALLPSRILDLCSPDGLIKLIEPKAQYGVYICLSYCWGGTQEFTTTQRTLGARLSGFHVHDLPETLRDAVKATRYFGVRFLWIDCLCICQDDREDWTRESARMANVYANAYLVLAAGHAAGHSAGLFHARTPRPSCRVDLPGYAQDVYVQSLHIRDECDQDAWAFRDESLSERGWAFQERVLAQRILHYNSRQLYYECEAGIVGEDGCYTESRENSLACLQKSSKDVQQPGTTDHSQWCSLIQNYSRRKLTHETDVLPAVGGLAAMFEKRIQASYLAGIWSDKLIDGLAWIKMRAIYREVYETRGQYIAPSWSWASLQAAVRTRRPFRRTNVAEVLDWKVDLKSEANPFGEVINGYIRLRAPLFSLVQAYDIVGNRYFDDAEKAEKYGLERSRWVRIPRIDSKEHRVDLDSDEYSELKTWNSLEMHFMILSQEDSDPQILSRRSLYFGLIVIKAPGLDSGRMRRIGWLLINVSEAQQICQDQDSWHTVILV